MELVLPQNYVEIEQEEMMYLDGVTREAFKVASKWLGVRAANYIAGTLVGNLLKFSGWMSVGDVAANLWDRYDVNPNNNRLNALW